MQPQTARVRVCDHCGLTRHAPCSPTCRAPDPHNPNNWRTSLQAGAGAIKETETP